MHRDTNVCKVFLSVLAGAALLEDIANLSLFETISVFIASTCGHLQSNSPYFRELVELLQERKIAVYLISGGFQSIIEPVAEELNILEKISVTTNFFFTTMVCSSKSMHLWPN